MKAHLHESLEDAAMTLPPDRATGLVLASASALAGAVWWSSLPAGAGVALMAVAGGLAAASLVAPRLLRPLNIAWMGLAGLLGRVVNPVVMLVLYWSTIVPFGLAMQASKDPLRSRPADSDETYWIVPEISFGPSDMTRQF